MLDTIIPIFRLYANVFFVNSLPLKGSNGNVEESHTCAPRGNRAAALQLAFSAFPTKVSSLLTQRSLKVPSAFPVCFRAVCLSRFVVQPE